jgi:hypothetical protein
VMKPIDEQIGRALRFKDGRPYPDDYEEDKRCNGLIFSETRVAKLLHLVQVPEDPQQFYSSTLTSPPAPPTLSASILVLGTYSPSGGTREDHQYRMQSPVQHPATDDRHSELPSPARKPVALQSWTSEPSWTSNSTLPPVLESGEDFSAEEMPIEHREMSLERPDAHEIQKRENITRLQIELRQLDASVIASVAKGKASFKRSSDLIPLLQHSRNCQSSDPRDRVYAFLGLAHHGYDVVPDYNPSNKVERVLIETAKSIIRHDKSLAVLQHVHRGREMLGVKLPSWVPDWTSKEFGCSLDQYVLDQSAPFDAAKGTPAMIEFSGNGQDGSYEDLKLRGVFVGKIDQIEFELPDFEHVSSFITCEGDWVIGPKAARLDDEVWVLCGSTKPVVLRPEGLDMFGYLGDVLVCNKVRETETSYFSPIMFGQMIERVQEGTAQARDIWLI